jgi:hypothetical protein
MTIPSVYKRDTTGNAYAASGERISGVVIGVTSATPTAAGNILSRAFTLAEQGVDGLDRSSAPKDVAYTVEALANTGTFAYNQVAFMFRGNQASNTINGTASTLLSVGGNEQYRDSDHSTVAPIGAKVLTAWASNSFDPLGVAGQRHNWGSGIPGTMTGTNFNNTFGGTATVDDAIGTDAVPGELTYMYGAILANTGEYQPRTLS